MYIYGLRIAILKYLLHNIIVLCCKGLGRDMIGHFRLYVCLDNQY